MYPQSVDQVHVGIDRNILMDLKVRQFPQNDWELRHLAEVEQSPLHLVWERRVQRDQVFEVNAPETNPLASESQDYATGSEVHLRVNCWQYLNIKKIIIRGGG